MGTAESAVSREAFEALREAYSETEAWKVAQLAATLAAGVLAGTQFETYDRADVVADAAMILAEARRQVAIRKGVE